MNNTIKALVILLIITLSCYAYLFGSHLGTTFGFSSGFSSFKKGGGGSTPSWAPGWAKTGGSQKAKTGGTQKVKTGGAQKAKTGGTQKAKTEGTQKAKTATPSWAPGWAKTGGSQKVKTGGIQKAKQGETQKAKTGETQKAEIETETQKVKTGETEKAGSSEITTTTSITLPTSRNYDEFAKEFFNRINVPTVGEPAMKTSGIGVSETTIPETSSEETTTSTETSTSTAEDEDPLTKEAIRILRIIRYPSPYQDIPPEEVESMKEDLRKGRKFLCTGELNPFFQDPQHLTAKSPISDEQLREDSIAYLRATFYTGEYEEIPEWHIQSEMEFRRRGGEHLCDPAKGMSPFAQREKESTTTAPAATAPATTAPAASGLVDVNKDGKLTLTIADFALLLDYWEKEVSNEDPNSQKVDLNGDKIVDIKDIAIMMDNWPGY